LEVTEHYIERSCRVLAATRGCLLLKLSPSGCKGIPDRMLLLPGGRIVFIEFKAPNKYPTPAQRHWHAKLRQQGCTVHVQRSVAEFRRLLDDMLAEL
jgi:hypothetical protein